uniref:NR LBD domain-containing protein n=1 Tax=Parascaris univalens TaxID=6257 RepID=A0A915A7I4_PARUN
MSSVSLEDYSELETPDSTIPSSLIFADGIDETSREIDGNDFALHIIRKDSSDLIHSKDRATTNKNCPLFCMVCAGRASGHHYDVASCNGCKAFFRRSYISGKRYKCKMSRKCSITEGKRTLCRACRYNKCVEVGMRPELMQFPSDVTSGQSVHVGAPKSPQHSETFAIQPASSNSLRFDESEYGAIIGTLVYNETKCNFLRHSTFDPTCTTSSLTDLINAPSELGNLHTYQLIRNWPKQQPPSLDYHGQQQFLEYSTSKLWILCDYVLNVEFAKTLTFFQRLSFNDKLLLLKNAALVNCSLVQSYYSYVNKSNTVVFPDGIFPILFTKSPLPVEVMMRCRGVESLIRSKIDKCEYVLLKAMVFTHYRMSVEGRTLLEKEREKIAKVLFSYTNARYGATAGSCRFATLVALVGTFFQLADKHRQFHTLLTVTWNLSNHPSKLFHEIHA